MTRHRRLTIWRRWGGTAALLLAALLGSRWLPDCRVYVSRSFEVGFESGRLFAVHYVRPQTWITSAPQFYVSRGRRKGSLEWWPAVRNWSDVRPYSTEVFVPLWTIAVLTGCGTWCLQRREAIARAGLCVQCEYDLRGNRSGVCPECGLAAGVERRVSANG